MTPRSLLRRASVLRRLVQRCERATDRLARMAALPLVTLETVTQGRPMLVVAPHPDDESLGCGGLIARACAAGEAVHVAFLTDGTGSHPHSRQYPSARLQAVREAEAKAAMAALGLPEDRLIFLRKPDGRAPLRGRLLDAAAAQLAELVHRLGIGTVLATWPLDPHADHLAAHRITEAAARRAPFRHLSYAVWGWTLPPTLWLPRRPVTGFRLDISGVLDAKRCAIACHRSQMTDMITDDSTAFRLPGYLLDLCDRPFEVFLQNEA